MNPQYRIAALVIGGIVLVTAVVVLVTSDRGASTPPVETDSVPVPTGPDVSVVVAVGDIACDPSDAGWDEGSSTECGQVGTSDLALALDPDAVLVLGDLQYECGGYEAFLTSYDASWGRLKAITHPVPGNHEYNSAAESESGTDCSTTTDAAGYFEYFGAAAGDPSEGWYSYDVGAWHVIALNSNCNKLGGCGGHSPQGEWLAADLAADDARCTLAYMHYPRFSSGQHGNSSSLDVLWELMDQQGVDLVLSGHDHDYERFAPLDASQQPDPQGIRSFVVGTGGKSLREFTSEEVGSEVRLADTFGVLRLALGPTSFGWRFLPVTGDSPRDEGSGACH
ncbi:MAG: metallophosphoesterase [Aeromicrobium sp.]